MLPKGAVEEVGVSGDADEDDLLCEKSCRQRQELLNRRYPNDFLRGSGGGWAKTKTGGLTGLEAVEEVATVREIMRSI